MADKRRYLSRDCVGEKKPISAGPNDPLKDGYYLRSRAPLNRNSGPYPYQEDRQIIAPSLMSEREAALTNIDYYFKD